MLEQQTGHGAHFTDAMLCKPFLMMPTMMHSRVTMLLTTSSSTASVAQPSCAEGCEMQGVCSLTESTQHCLQYTGTLIDMMTIQ